MSASLRRPWTVWRARWRCAEVCRRVQSRALADQDPAARARTQHLGLPCAIIDWLCLGGLQSASVLRARSLPARCQVAGLAAAAARGAVRRRIHPIIRVEKSVDNVRPLAILLIAAVVTVLAGCATAKYPSLPEATYELRSASKYKIGPGDSVEIFVWRYPEVSTTVPVRPDGYITAPLLEDIPASGKTPTELARDLEEALSVYLRDPLVTVIVQGFQGVYPEQIRVLGEATNPRSLRYLDGMTLLDLMISVGGVTQFAAGNRAVLMRFEDGEKKRYTVRLEDLVKDADLSANVDMQPGDILVIPESWF